MNRAQERMLTLSVVSSLAARTSSYANVQPDLLRKYTLSFFLGHKPCGLFNASTKSRFMDLGADYASAFLSSPTIKGTAAFAS
jgi:hypothetical protein